MWLRIIEIKIGLFQIFSKIWGDIRSSMCTTGVVYTSGKWKQSSIIKVLIIFFGHLWEVELTYRYIFAFKFFLRSQQPDIVPIICHLCHWIWWQICHRYQQHQRNWRQNLQPVSLIPVANLHLDLQLSPQIFENIWNGPNGILWGCGETDSWKNQKKISWHCPFNRRFTIT